MRDAVSVHAVTRRLADVAGAILGREISFHGEPYGADMRLFTERGIPCVMIGPGDPHGAHAVDERVAVDELVRAAQLMTLVVLRFLGVV